MPGTSTCRSSTRSDAVLRRMRRPGDARRATSRLLRRIRRPRSRRHAPHDVHRRVPRRDRGGVRRARRVRARTSRFDHVGVFTYSHEEGTTAGALRDDVPRRVKRRASGALMTTAEARSSRAAQPRAGRRPGVGAGGRPVAGARRSCCRGRLAGPGARHRLGRLPDRRGPAGACRAGRADLTAGGRRRPRGYDLVARPLREPGCGPQRCRAFAGSLM